MIGCQLKYIYHLLRRMITSARPRVKFTFFFPVFVLIPLSFGYNAGIQALPVEGGLTFSRGVRSRDRFDRGIEKYRSTLSLTTISVVDAESFRNTTGKEFFLRVGELFDDDNHYLGLGVGSRSFDDFDVTEFRSDRTLVSMNWKINASYLLFTYDYIGRLTRKWKWEGGVGYGFVFSPRLRINGFTANSSSVTEYNAVARGRLGNVARVHLGVKRILAENFILRFGLRSDYLYMGPFSGQINSLDSDWYFLQNGSLANLSAYDVLEASTTTVEDNALRVSLLGDKALITAGLQELYFSIGFRF